MTLEALFEASQTAEGARESAGTHQGSTFGIAAFELVSTLSSEADLLTEDDVEQKSDEEDSDGFH